MVRFLLVQKLGSRTGDLVVMKKISLYLVLAMASAGLVCCSCPDSSAVSGCPSETCDDGSSDTLQDEPDPESGGTDVSPPDSGSDDEIPVDSGPEDTVGFDCVHTVFPAPSSAAFANPLKGFRPDLGNDHPFGTLFRHYIKWNEIENDASDGVDKIRAFSSEAWASLPSRNAKVIPRVYLEWPGEGQYWPADLQSGDYQSGAFKSRLEQLIRKMGEAWDGDPRVAWIETAIIGYWGEQHTPSPSPEIQHIMGTAFTEAFTRKKLLNRYPDEFVSYPWGIYWDCYGTDDYWEIMGVVTQRWRTVPFEGEIAYNYNYPAGPDPVSDVSVPGNIGTIVYLVRNFHTSALGWIASAPYNSSTREGIETIQKAFGYRFVIEAARYPAGIHHGGSLAVELSVRNLGSAPFYYDWPLEISLLDRDTLDVVWKERVEDIDIRQWLPGEGWNGTTYTSLPTLSVVHPTVVVPAAVPAGIYILAVAVLDPAGHLPSLRFAIEPYFSGGRHPLGLMGVEQVAPRPDLEIAFDDIQLDTSLHYVAP